MNPRALFFDLDGVLVNTEPLHMQAWQKTLQGLGMSLTSKDYEKELLGLNDRDLAAKIFAKHKKILSAELLEKLIHQKEKYSHELFSHEIPLISGADSFLKNVFEKVPLALVTGALRNEAYFILDHLRWRKYFSIVITAQDVVLGKPNPEGYLRAFEKMQKLQEWNPPLKKSECLIFEDSKFGIEAAKKAGIPCHEITSNNFTTASYFPNGGKI